ncbi:MAG TPA: SGNH/GDSL hydrolase family protein [Candidatus Methylacidiphilales bacterium]
MKRVFLAAALSLAFLPGAFADFLIRPNDVVAICGDSITEQKLYSTFVEDYLLMCQPTAGQRIVQLGWGGERVPGFLARLQTDLFPFKPTVVTTCYGMNDGSYTTVRPDIVETYRKALSDTVDKLKQNGVRAIVVGTPGAVDTETFKGKAVPAEVYNENLRQLGEAARDVAQKAGTAFADIHAPMIDAMAKAKAAYGPAYAFAGGDGVHPGPNGHLVMAQAILKGLGCDGAIGTVTLDLAANKAEGTPGQKIVSAKDGVVEIESARYPFWFEGEPGKAETSPAAIVGFTTFNDDLNRYLLVVKGLKGSRAKVTWSGADGNVSVSKEFPAADLAKGVNLPAAFLGETPFKNAFIRVHIAVLKQQIGETLLVKSYLHNISGFKEMAPGKEAALDEIAVAALDRDASLFKAAADLVVPVRHAIKVEALP